MSLSKLWVLAEPSGDSFTSTSLELLTQARALSADVAAITWGAGSSLAALAGEYGATTLYDVGDFAGALPGVPVAAAIPPSSRVWGRPTRSSYRPVTTAATWPVDCRPAWTVRSSRTSPDCARRVVW